MVPEQVLQNTVTVTGQRIRATPALRDVMFLPNKNVISLIQQTSLTIIQLS